MANEALRKVIQHLHKVADLHGPSRSSDAQLLERFAVTRDQAAFEVLVWRHGPMVLNLCRRILHHEHDAEDAFQATFLTLVRKAGSIAKREAVGSWLYKVAYRVALEANARSTQRAARETTSVATLAAKRAQDLAGRELELALGEEVNRLPDRYRVPLVLHCFEGKSSHELAQQLGCAEATVRTRLARARERLRVRLVRRGLAPSAGLVAAGPVQSVVPAALVDSTVKAATQFAAGKAAATGAISAHAAALTEKVLKLMFLNKLKQVATVVVLVSVFSAGAGLSIRQALAQKPAVQDTENLPKLATKEANQSKDDRTEIRGTWVNWGTVTRSTDRQTFPPEQVKVTYVITDDKMMRVGDDGFLDNEVTFKLDPTQRPKTIDTTDRITGLTLLGIYQLEGDTLKISYGDNRPTEFSAEPYILKRISRTFAPVAQRFANAPGCFWMINPMHPPASMGTAATHYFYDEERDGSVVITMAYAYRTRIDQGEVHRNLRPILIDAAGTRYLPKMMSGGGSSIRNGPAMAMFRWRMDPIVLPARNVAQIGIEAVTPEALRHVAREALERAKIAQIEVLPWPEAGEAYPFTLTTIDGRKIRSDDLKGKVVLIDCWSTTCHPCMAMMPELKTLYKKWHKQGLEILGISFDQDVETVQKACKSEGLTWPQVVVADDETVRNLWREASGSLSIPRVLLIDQQGVLQADSSDKLEDKITKLLTGSSEKSPAKPKP